MVFYGMRDIKYFLIFYLAVLQLGKEYITINHLFGDWEVKTALWK